MRLNINGTVPRAMGTETAKFGLARKMASRPTRELGWSKGHFTSRHLRHPPWRSSMSPKYSGGPRTGSVSAERDATTEPGLVGNRPDDAPAENRVDQQAVQVDNEWDIGRDMNVVDKVSGAMAGSGRFE
jgi:hypothetical protein